jgi:hypothetical protein
MLRLRVPRFLEAGLSPTKGPEDSALILRRAGIGALLVSISAGMTSNLLFLAAFQFRLDVFLEPTLILASGGTSAALLRWAAVLDLLGTTSPRRSSRTCCGSSCAPAIHSSLTCRLWPRSAMHWPVG